MATDPTEQVAVRLAPDELALIDAALRELGGTASGTVMASIVAGVPEQDAAYLARDRLLALIRAGQPLTRTEWSRVLLFTELAFASDLLGSGVEWPTMTGLEDQESIAVLRALQRRLVGVASVRSILTEVFRVSEP